MLDLYNILVGFVTIIGVAIAVYQISNEIDKRKLKRKRTSEILKIKVERNINYVISAFNKFEHNYKIHLKSSNKEEVTQLQHIINYYINSYINDKFIDNVNELLNNLEEFYRINIDDDDLKYDEYRQLWTLTRGIYQDLKNNKYIFDRLFPNYDEEIEKNMKTIILNKSYVKNDKLITDNLNGMRNTFIANPIMYYGDKIVEYNKYFHNVEDIPIPLINTNKEPGYFSSFTREFDFDKTHNELRSLIKKVNEYIS
ncbi:hypothetical protein [Mammaliicoccus sp. M-M49]|nr:hypothetical protein [Mammaliicoccus sp. M-M49]